MLTKQRIAHDLPEKTGEGDGTVILPFPAASNTASAVVLGNHTTAFRVFHMALAAAFYKLIHCTPRHRLLLSCNVGAFHCMTFR